MDNDNIMQILNTTGLNCPEPIMLLHQAVRTKQDGEQICMVATDPASVRDVANFCRHLGHILTDQQTKPTCDLPSIGDEQTFDNYYYYYIQVKKP